MTLGGKSDGCELQLSASETKRFLAGEVVKKISGDCHGMFRITVKLTRPRSLKKRFPKELYGDMSKSKE